MEILRYSAKHIWPCLPNSEVPEKRILTSGVVLLCWILLQYSAHVIPLWPWHLTFWPQDVKCSVHLYPRMHRWRNFGENLSNTFQDIALTMFRDAHTDICMDKQDKNITPLSTLQWIQPGPSRGGEAGKFSRARDVWGASQSLKNTEKCVPDGFFLTSNMHKIHLAYQLTTLPRRWCDGVRWCEGTPRSPSTLDFGAYVIGLWQGTAIMVSWAPLWLSTGLHTATKIS